MAGLAPADMRLLIQTTLEDLPKQNFAGPKNCWFVGSGFEYFFYEDLG